MLPVDPALFEILPYIYLKVTFIMRMSVLRAIMTMIKYSNGDETTSFHILYFKDSLSLGM